jgi:hypothetical protein
VEAWRGVGTTGGRVWERRGTFSLVSLVCSFWFVWFKFIGSSSSVLGKVEETGMRDKEWRERLNINERSSRL